MVELEAVVRKQKGIIESRKINSIKLLPLVGKKVKVKVEKIV